MKEFPSRLKPENKDKFYIYRFERNLTYLRKQIYELVLFGNENSYFELDNFAHSNKISNKDIEKMCNSITEELKKLGWKTQTSFGGTGLFIYSTQEPPPSCYEDEL